MSREHVCGFCCVFYFGGERISCFFLDDKNCEQGLCSVKGWPVALVWFCMLIWCVLIWRISASCSGGATCLRRRLALRVFTNHRRFLFLLPEFPSPDDFVSFLRKRWFRSVNHYIQHLTVNLSPAGKCGRGFLLLFPLPSVPPTFSASCLSATWRPVRREVKGHAGPCTSVGVTGREFCHFLWLCIPPLSLVCPPAGRSVTVFHQVKRCKPVLYPNQ